MKDFRDTDEYSGNGPLTDGDNYEKDALSLPLEVDLNVNDTNHDSNVQENKKLYACDQCDGRLGCMD